MTESTTLDDHLSSQVVRTDPVTESEVLEVLTTHFIENSESLVKELGLKSRITVNDFTPRPHQLKLLTEVINSIITKGTKTFVINAPTGSGKSYLGVAITILLDYYNISKITPISKSLLLTFRNNLFEQYLDSYS
jgi:superfamily II DNA or RNA helicase